MTCSCENVGNLICPANFRLGTHKNVLIASVPEGDDKPYKYPGVYRGVDALIINKIDLLPYVPFDMDYFRRGVEMLNPGLVTFPLSCRTGEGLPGWTESATPCPESCDSEWLPSQMTRSRIHRWDSSGPVRPPRTRAPARLGGRQEIESKVLRPAVLHPGAVETPALARRRTDVTDGCEGFRPSRRPSTPSG
jgi:hypothetical protein